jgi:hypothetical protein
MSTCKSCSATITWAISATTGRKMPMQRDPAGTFVVDDQGIARHEGKAPNPPIEGVATVQRYSSHFSTCGQAASWRGKR